MKAGIKSKHTVVIGTAQGDLYDIGNSLVAMMWKGAHFGVVDMGTDVSPEKFAAAVKERNAELGGLLARLTTAMSAMKTAVATL